MDSANYLKGRGAQINTPNRFIAERKTTDSPDGIDAWDCENPQTTFIETTAKTIVNKVDSPDVNMLYSMNPYMGCEHGCIYCYARNSFEYWGYSAGVDFESKILVKKNAPELLRKFLSNPNWVCEPISLSGNTDCYQPAERKYRLTRELLQICNEYHQPAAIITKNATILRDKDLLAEMAAKKIVSVIFSITSTDEEIRRAMEPRTATTAQRFKAMEELSAAGVKTGVMMGPVIPGLNDHFMHDIFARASNCGATFSAYTFVRLNGAVQILFKDWLFKNFPDRAKKVWHLIEQGHDGRVSDSRWGVRMRGEGVMAEIINQQYKKYTKKFNLHHERWDLDCTRFRRPFDPGTLFYGMD